MSKKFLIKNVGRDDWARFLFQEMRKDEKRPEGNNWLTSREISKIASDKISYHTFRLVLGELVQRNECEQFVGNIRSNKGTIIKAVWYRHKKYDWKTFFKKNIYKLQKQRLPQGENWFTIKQLSSKTGLGRAKILRLIRENKLNKKVKIFDGYAFNPKRNFLERKIWYKLCQNG